MLRCALISCGVLLPACSLHVEPIECKSDAVCGPGARCVEHVCVDAPIPACVTTLSAGANHTCAVLKDGSSWCWGRNDVGQLGDGLVMDHPTPVKTFVQAMSGVVSVGGGRGHTCVVGGAGRVWCWGANGSSQAGTLPGSPVNGIDGGASAVVAGDTHSCALVSGGVMCWGDNTRGQLGIGKERGGSTAIAVSVTDIPGQVTKLATRNNTNCAISSVGGATPRLWCWGEVAWLVSTDPPLAYKPVAVTIPGGESPVDVSVGTGFVCAVTAAGAVFCVGRNDRGQTGQPDNTLPSMVLQPVNLPVPAREIVAGSRFACAIDKQRRAWCWGDDTSGELADGKLASHAIPVLASYPDVAELVAGNDHLCVRAQDGNVQCSGGDAQGQLGDGMRTTQSAPQPVPNLTGAIGVAAGDRHTCAVFGDGTVQCWGANDLGALGDETWTSRGRAAPVLGVRGATQIAVGRNHSCALADGQVWCWGRNQHSQLGYADVFDDLAALPHQVSGLVGVTQIAAGGDQTCALVGSGAASTVKCWGAALDGVAADSAMPTDVNGLAPGATLITVSATHACARAMNATVWCWGRNGNGQLGIDLKNTSSATAIAVAPLAGVDLIAAGRGFTCAHTGAAGQAGVWCWGVGAEGELGDNRIHPLPGIPSPVQVLGVTDAVTLAAGDSHVCASNGTMLFCWGGDVNGQLGDGHYDNAPMPKIIALDGVSRIALGLAHSCAITTGGAVACWGDGRFGQLGDDVLAPPTGRPVVPQLTCR